MTWMVTASGRKFHPHDPKADEIDIFDIATGLSKLCRFAGQCSGYYSVAEHSVHVSYLVPSKHALQALLHDATEAYYGDITRPFKSCLPDYRRMEDRLWAVIAGKYGLPAAMHPTVKQADMDILLSEKAALFPANTDVWDVPGSAAPVSIRQWDWGLARYMFHKRFNELTASGDYL